MWQFGENTLSVYLVQNPTLLYFLDFMGLFLLMIPLYAMALFYLNKKGTLLLESVRLLIEATVLITVVLQFTGTVSFHRSLFVYHILLPLAMLLLFGTSLYETVRYQNGNAKRFMIPFLVLSVSAVLELLNYYLHFTGMLSVIFQFGVFTFAVIMMVLSVLYILSLLADQRKKAELEGELRIRDQVLSYQKSRLEALSLCPTRPENSAMISVTICVPLTT